ncbi:uncharacterized protein TM35_000301010 [Trypanosoma theileri]|uniref:Uncharacterized protein n=1 Tax=Trypanosoma theileri TaxID=67003 RepID=A0A1X0NN75_9TRYP|nr:uncharacterized protein TM35_000301010 [Trypanosoma theileri]ORC86061.1 hypothetical protein TM35_000301010 [Trypanosoma theileri]
MTGGVHVRTAAAVRTAVLWVSLCMLLQHLGHHPQFTAEAEGSVQVKIVRYFTLPNSAYTSTAGGRVNYGNSVTVCNMNGGSLVAGQSTAAQNAITDQLRPKITSTVTLPTTYMGGDAIYSTRFESDPSQKCTPGVQGASINCIYRWNQGLFTQGTVDGHGVPFYRGSYYSVPGAGPLNGYTPFWPISYPLRGNPYVISQYQNSLGKRATWYDGPEDPTGNTDVPSWGFVVVCEVQDTITGSAPIPTTTPTTKPPIPTTTTTTIPTTDPTTAPPQAASDPSWIKKHWYVPLIIAVVVLAAIIGLIILCCCLGGRDDEKYLPPMVSREASDMPLRAREITDGDVDDMYFEDQDVSMVPPEPMPMEDIEYANVSVYSAAENDIYGDGDVFAVGNR